MKRRTIILLIVLLLVLGIAVLAIVCNRRDFSGSRAANPDSYRLDIVRMTGTDRHTLKLKAGDTLLVRFETQEGSLHMEITAPDGTALYTGNGGEATDFTVNVSEDGAYTITVEAQHAKGTVFVQRKEEQAS